MAKKRKLSPNELAKLKGDLAGLKTIKNYTPAKDEFKTADVEIVDARQDSLRVEIAQVEARLDDLRHQDADTGAEYLQKMKGVRQQIVAQFGDDSPEYEAVGGIRSSARRTGLHRGKNGNNIKPNG